MTTPAIRAISWAQERKLRAADWFSRWLTAGVPAWKSPSPDKVVVNRDRTPVMVSEKVRWPAQVDLPVLVAPSYLDTHAGVRLTGMPMEAVAPNAAHLPVYVTSEENGDPRVELVPLRPGYAGEVVDGPPRDQAWLEGLPAVGGMFDRHWVGVYPDGTRWELYCARWSWNVLVGGWCWWATEAAQYLPDGTLLKGHKVIAGAHSLASYVATKATLDDPCVIGLTLPNYHGHDGDLPELFPAIGDRVRLPNPPGPEWTGDARKFLMNAHTHGFKIIDRTTGPAVVHFQAGDLMPGSNLATVRFRTSELERVTS